MSTGLRMAAIVGGLAALSSGVLADTGACCITMMGGVQCMVMTEQNCTAHNGVYQGNGTTCQNAPCGAPAATGACCLSGHMMVCMVTTEANCDAHQGVYQGDGTTCENANCPGAPQTGACCIATPNGAVCHVMTEHGCLHHNGVFMGAGVPCEPSTCDPGVVGSSCYANCDGSNTAPVLNVADFACFLQRFAAGSLWANCDQSVTEPVLNVADFACFLQAFAAGCR